MLTATYDAFDTTQTVQFNVGDVVTLKTGGSRMTVTYVGQVAGEAEERLVCQWFDDQGELRQETFSQDNVRRQPRSIPAGSVHLHKVISVVMR
ncbi:YodC family protein [Paraburkholderia phymatum]|uniref:YodC family protein n=1 Tax=Paraburkholderia phymatum TaxID=148447 RepID=A0ACC6TVQ5_9BURK